MVGRHARARAVLFAFSICGASRSLALHGSTTKQAKELAHRTGVRQIMAGASDSQSKNSLMDVCRSMAMRVRDRLTASGSLLPSRRSIKSRKNDAVQGIIDEHWDLHSRNGDHVVDRQWASYRRMMHNHLGWSLGFSRTPSKRKNPENKINASMRQKSTTSRV